MYQRADKFRNTKEDIFSERGQNAATNPPESRQEVADTDGSTTSALHELTCKKCGNNHWKITFEGALDQLHSYDEVSVRLWCETDGCHNSIPTLIVSSILRLVQ